MTDQITCCHIILILLQIHATTIIIYIKPTNNNEIYKMIFFFRSLNVFVTILLITSLPVSSSHAGLNLTYEWEPLTSHIPSIICR